MRKESTLSYRRHPPEVTSHRLLLTYEKWWDRMDGDEREALSFVRHALERIADEDREQAQAGKQGQS